MVKLKNKDSVWREQLTVCRGIVNTNRRLVNKAVILLLTEAAKRYSAHVASPLKKNWTIATAIYPACSFCAIAIKKIWVEYNQKLEELTVPWLTRLSASAIYLDASNSVTIP